jgi:hypothetical protein
LSNPENSEQNPRENPSGNVTTLYTELDSIVFNLLDFAYFNSQWDEDTVVFSIEALGMLTRDTLLFQRDNAFFQGFEDTAVFLRTKFAPKGWLAFVDMEDFLLCRPDDASGDKPWFARRIREDGFESNCFRNADRSPATRSLWIAHYQGKGFLLDRNTPVGDFGLGKTRVYYWR